MHRDVAAYDRDGAMTLRMPRPGKPVGLEYSIVVVICVSSLHRGLSGGDVVLVRESAEDVSSADPVLSEVDLRWPGVSLSRCELAEGTVRTGCVVIINEAPPCRVNDSMKLQVRHHHEFEAVHAGISHKAQGLTDTVLCPPAIEASPSMSRRIRGGLR